MSNHYHSKDEELIQRGLDLFRELKEKLTDEEWQELNEAASKAMEELIPEDLRIRFDVLEEEMFSDSLDLED